MTGLSYLLGAYGLSLALLWGYAAMLWLTKRRLETYSPPSTSPRS